MTTITTDVDPDNLMAFVFRAVEEAGAALNSALVVMGDRLGYYRSLAQHGASTPAELAERTETDEHYAREWLNAQAAGSFVTYDVSTGRYFLPPENAMALLDETSPAFVGGLFQLVYGTLRDATQIVDVARTGDGVSWGEHNADVHIGCERFFRPTYATHVVDDWIPALDGVVDKLASGAQSLWQKPFRSRHSMAQTHTPVPSTPRDCAAVIRRRSLGCVSRRPAPTS